MHQCVFVRLDGKLNEICSHGHEKGKLDLWSSLDDLLRSLITILLEILHKQCAQLCHFLLEVGTASPALRRVQHLGRNAGARLWYMQVECLVSFILYLRELAGMNRVKDGASVFQRTAFAASGGTCTCPASVEKPCIGVVVGDLVC